jgi:tripartite-type tricarboxylate transporter receptor subunit TctC
MKLPRRQFLHLAVGGVVALPAVRQIANAQVIYPVRPITMIVPFPPGGVTDAIGRVVAERMRRLLGQPLIIENVSGAEGSIGIGCAANARPDGYVIDLGQTDNHVLNGAFFPLGYDVLNDFAPIAPLVTVPFVRYARKTIPAKNLRELITWIKANPGKVSAGVPVPSIRLLTTSFQKETGTQFVPVPYRGEGPVIQDLVAGQIDLYIGSSIQLKLVQAGSIKAYAVTTDTRVAVAPEIPTFLELGLPALSFSEWVGLFAPKGTPRDIIGRLNAAALEALADPEVRSRLIDLAHEAFPRDQQTPEVLGALVKADAERWWPIMKELGIRAE